MLDSFYTIAGTYNGLYKEKGSKFLALATPVESEKEINEIIHQQKKDHYNARHHCYAYRLGASGENYKANDDNEPAYTAGKPILGQIDAFGLSNVVVVVVRYFGGTLLGKGGLINAYKSAAREALAQAKKIEVTIDDYFRIECGYEDVDFLMRLFSEINVVPKNQVFEEKCTFEIGVRKSTVPVMTKKLEPFHKIKYQYLYTF